MKKHRWNETFEERRVTYTQELAGRFVVVEGVPARVCRETGETLFSPETVDQLQTIIRGQLRPARVIETPVYDFAVAKTAA
ncbi:MAG: YgiT-type zinc finger protein [Verrucomicrobiota bacterium]|jgi:YgiT-type zinc finger domain-containing protein